MKYSQKMIAVGIMAGINTDLDFVDWSASAQRELVARILDSVEMTDAVHAVCEKAENDLDKIQAAKERVGENIDALGRMTGIVKEAYIDKTGSDEKPNPMRDVFQEFPLAMAAVAEVTAYGAKKHAPRGWQTFDPVYGFAYHTAKLGRHLLAEETNGSVNKADGDILHAAQVAWNAMARLEHLLRGADFYGLTKEDFKKKALTNGK